MMNECDCCGYAGQDLPKHRELLKQAAEPRIAELEAEVAKLEAFVQDVIKIYALPIDLNQGE